MKKNEVERKLTRSGCYIIRQGKEHEVWFSPITNQTISIPRHGAKEVATGMLRKIEKISGVKF
jgi:predicted RNA binding protein YcfA (HicA-like mRNA interferase family)